MKVFDMDKNELQRQICEMERQAEADQKKRNIITIVAFAVIFFLMFYFDEKPSGIDDVIGMTVASFMASAFYFGINGAVFGWLYEKNESDRRMIGILKKQLSETEDNI